MEKENVVNIQPIMLSQVENQFTEQIQEDFSKKILITQPYFIHLKQWKFSMY